MPLRTAPRNLRGMSTPLIRLRRSAGVASAAALAILGLTACGGGGGSASGSTVAIQPSSYLVKDAATTTTVPTVAAPDAEGRSAAEQTFVVRTSQDVPFNIAKLFDIDLEELRKFNGWDEDFSGFEGVGSTVRIPPGAKFIDPNATTTTAAAAAGEDGEEEDGDEGTASAGSCTPGTHKLEDGDFPVKVAKKYNVTVDALLAANGFSMDANGNVPQWPATGGTVTIPAAPTCTTTTTLAPG